MENHSNRLSFANAALLLGAGVVAEFLFARSPQKIPAPPRLLADPSNVRPKPGFSAKPIRDDTRQTLIQIAKNVFVRVNRDNLSLVAAGVAFYAMTAIFPAIAVFVSIYGLFADPAKVQDQIASLSSLLPAASLKLLTDALHAYASKSNSSLSLALVVSFAFALWSAKAGVSSLMTGLNIANEQDEKRSFLVQQLVALALTSGAVIFSIVALSAVAILPVALSFLPMPPLLATILSLGRWPLLMILVGLGLAIIYRFGAYKEHPKWRWITWGAAIATLLWVMGSAGFSFYVSKFGSYDATYGSLAAPVVLLLWFWLSALVVLVGEEIDAELDHADKGEVRRPPDGSP
jgi:membrane protein